MRSAYTLRRDDDDYGQANTLVNEIMDGAARDRLVANVVGHVLVSSRRAMLLRVFTYWHNIDETIGRRIEEGVKAGRG